MKDSDVAGYSATADADEESDVIGYLATAIVDVCGELQVQQLNWIAQM